MRWCTRSGCRWVIGLAVAVGLTAGAEAGLRAARRQAAPVQQYAAPAVQQQIPVQSQSRPAQGQYRPIQSQWPIPSQPSSQTPAPAPVTRPSGPAWSAPSSPVDPIPVAPVAYGSSIITFDNQSGEAALVRLVGPTRSEVHVPHGTQNAIHQVAPGHYVIRVRYGNPGQYRYTEGDAFDVEGSATTYSHVTITLHGVVAGNYSMQDSSEASFNAAAR